MDWMGSALVDGLLPDSNSAGSAKGLPSPRASVRFAHVESVADETKAEKEVGGRMNQALRHWLAKAFVRRENETDEGFPDPHTASPRSHTTLQSFQWQACRPKMTAQKPLPDQLLRRKIGCRSILPSMAANGVLIPQGHIAGESISTLHDESPQECDGQPADDEANDENPPRGSDASDPANNAGTSRPDDDQRYSRDWPVSRMGGSCSAAPAQVPYDSTGFGEGVGTDTWWLNRRTDKYRPARCRAEHAYEGRTSDTYRPEKSPRYSEESDRDDVDT